jgi:CheY-like chemotaxis protein
MNPTFNKFNEDLISKSKYSKFQDFHNLMRFRIRDILLVSSLYDSYIFEEDGRLYELIRKEYLGLNLSQSPELVQCSSGKEALKLITSENRFDLIIITPHIEDMPAINFAREIKNSGIDIPVVLLGYDNLTMMDLLIHKDLSVFDKAFIWQGDYRIILGIIKYLEDRKNVEHDTLKVGVQSIILIEDNVRFYSSYLPLIYTEVLKQSQSLLQEGINLSHKFLRMRARPKILLCSSYEEAWDYYEKYEEHVLGIISDIDFSKNGKSDPRAGIEFCEKVKFRYQHIPILLQSSVQENEKIADDMGVAFIYKNSPTLLHDVRDFAKNNFSFGNFAFTDDTKEDFGSASNLIELEHLLRLVPDSSIIYHASRNQFSNWIKARTEFWLAHRLRPKKVSDFNSVSELRKMLINYVHEFRTSRQVGVISDFDVSTFDKRYTFARIGGGSLGGKARGLGFVNSLLSNFDIRRKIKGVEIFVPSGVVIGSDIFDQFLDDNYLRDFALRARDNKMLTDRFLKAKRFDKIVVNSLTEYLSIEKEPIAVRSSSLLEDSQGQPFAGVYDTIMLPNNHPDLDIRLQQLLNAIKQIYSSVFSKKSKDYIKATSYRLEEEKMAIIVQRLVGAEHNGKFYPEISGVAKSYNFYPAPPLQSNDGITSVALGLGKMIVEGGNTVRFCPKHPNHSFQYASIEDTLRFSPQEFFALELNTLGDKLFVQGDELVKKYSIDEADKDNTLEKIGSTYSAENDAIYDGIARSGTRLFSIAPVLKYNYFPLPDIILLLLEMGSWGMGAPIEIEFAVNLSVDEGSPIEFAFLQMRPLVLNSELEELEITGHMNIDLICSSKNVLGNGVIADIRDIVFVDLNKFDRSKGNDTAYEINQFNSKLLEENRPYLLIGAGRLGTLDPWLGIPVTWEQISGVRAIVESNFKDFNVTPSQGSHFFQNLTSFRVGFFTVDQFTEKGFIDWEWLSNQPVKEEKEYTKHVRFDEPIVIKINGIQNQGVIIKPNS